MLVPARPQSPATRPSMAKLAAATASTTSPTTRTVSASIPRRMSLLWAWAMYVNGKPFPPTGLVPPFLLPSPLPVLSQPLSCPRSPLRRIPLFYPATPAAYPTLLSCHPRCEPCPTSYPATPLRTLSHFLSCHPAAGLVPPVILPSPPRVLSHTVFCYEPRILPIPLQLLGCQSVPYFYHGLLPCSFAPIDAFCTRRTLHMAALLIHSVPTQCFLCWSCCSRFALILAASRIHSASHRLIRTPCWLAWLRR